MSNKTRDEQAHEYAVNYFGNSEKDLFDAHRESSTLERGFKDGFDAAEKQYLGEIQELKFERGEYKKAAESWMKSYDELKEKYEPLVLVEQQCESLKADLESAIKNIEVWESDYHEIFCKEECNCPPKFSLTLKSKLGRGEK